MPERFRPLLSYHLKHVFKFWGVLFPECSDHQLDEIIFYRSVFAWFNVFILSEVSVFSIFFFQNSKLFYNPSTLPDLKTCYLAIFLKSILRWRCMLKSNQHSYCDHVNQNKSFCIKNGQTILCLILTCRVLQNRIKHGRFTNRSLISTYEANWLIKGNAVAQKQYFMTGRWKRF